MLAIALRTLSFLVIVAMAQTKEQAKQIEPVLNAAVERARTDMTYGDIEPDLRPRLPKHWQISGEETTRVKYRTPLIVNELFRVYAYIVVRKTDGGWKADPPFTTTMHARRK